MTELEKELLQTVKEQPKIFEEKIKNLTREYQENMNKALITIENYQKQLREAGKILKEQDYTIQKQSELLEKLLLRYESMSSLEIGIKDQELIEELKNTQNGLEDLEKKFQYLEKYLHQ